MPDTATGAMADHLAHWAPPTVETSRRIDPWPSAAFAALIDAEPPGLDAGTPLPPLWHWFTLLDHPAFVTVRHELSADGVPVAAEEQDVVYRSEPEGAPRRTMHRPASGESEPAGTWRRTLPTGPVLLSRFSALTYNGHRIHYDTPYATGVEGYPDLVVHGPLLALLALELPRLHAPDARVADFTYRLIRPAFTPDTVVAAGSRDGDTAEIAVAAEGAAPSLAATLRFVPAEAAR